MSVRSFMVEYRAGTELITFSRFWCKCVNISIAPHRTWITLCRIEAINAGNGDGGRALKWLCWLADKHGVRISGMADPFGSRFLELEKLLDWYVRHGFDVTVSDCYYIDREPRELK